MSDPAAVPSEALLANGGRPRHVPAARGASPTVAEALPVAILIVDDNAAERLATKAVLSPLGYRVVEAVPGWRRCVV